MNRELAKLNSRIDAQQKLLESQRPDPEKLAKIQQLKAENSATR